MLVSNGFARYFSKRSKVKQNANFKYPKDFFTNSPQEPEAHQFYSEFKPLIYALAAVGRFPFGRDSENRLHCSFMSFGGLYWTVAYLITSVIAYDTLSTSFAQIFSRNISEDVMIGMRNASLLILHFALPLNWPSEWRMLCRYINEWDEFLVEWQRLTGKKLLAGVHWKCLLCSIGYPILLVGVVFMENDTLGKQPTGLFMYWWLLCGGFYHSAMFMLTLAVSQTLSEYLNFNLIDIVERSKNRTRIGPTEIQKLRYLWIKGSDLLIKSGSAMGQSCFMIYLVNTVWVVMDVYRTVKSLMHFEYILAFHSMYLAVACLTYVIVGCEFGHRASRKMKDEIIATLASVDLSGLTDWTAKELIIFFQVISINDPAVVCGGFITMDRSHLTTACSNTITYLIVLIQLKTEDIDIVGHSNDT